MRALQDEQLRELPMEQLRALLLSLQPLVEAASADGDDEAASSSEEDGTLIRL